MRVRLRPFRILECRIRRGTGYGYGGLFEWWAWGPVEFRRLARW